MTRARLLAACLLVAASPAAAQGPDLDRRGLTLSESPCIGQPDTPICAAETFLACLVLAREDLCAAVGAPLLEVEARRERLEYRLAAPRMLTWQDLGTEAFRDHLEFEAVVDIEERYCARSPCAAPWRATRLVLHPAGHRWEIAHWRPESPDIRVIGRDIASTRCFDTSRSPVCALDALFACVMRGDTKTCAPFRHRSQLCYRKRSTVAFYWILEMRFAHYLLDRDMRPELEIGALHRTCDHRSEECEPWHGIDHRLEYKDGRWEPETGYFEICGSHD